MLNYIKAEFYRTFKRVAYWCFLGVCCAAIICLFLLSAELNKSNANKIELGYLLGILAMVLPVPLYMMPIIVDMISGEENKIFTSKNALAYGLSRNSLYLSKLFVSVCLGILSVVILLGFYMIVGFVIFGAGENLTAEVLQRFFKMIGLSMPLWIGGMSLCVFMSFVIRNGSMFSFAYVMLFILAPKIVENLAIYISDKFMIIYDNLISVQFSNMLSYGGTNFPPEFTAKVILVGLGFTAITTLLGLVWIKKVEFK